MITIAYLSKDRPVYLKRSITSMLQQTILPERIVVVDCSENRESIERVINSFNTLIPIDLFWRPVKELSRSQGRHLGCDQATTPLVASTESDIIFEPEIIELTLKAFGDPVEKKYIQPQVQLQNEQGINGKIRKRHRSGFFQAFRISDFKTVGGYNPFLSGWGSEDSDFKYRMKKRGCKVVTLPTVATHLWHPPADKKGTNAKNLEIIASSCWDGEKWVRSS